MMDRLLQFFQPGPSCSHATGVYVPLYVYPSGAGMKEYETVVRTKLAHPGVPAVVAINPSSGAGDVVDANYERASGMLRGAGITVLGYVYTSWGRRSIGEAASEIRRYASWYSVDGVMIDEFSTDVQIAGYYRKLRQYATSLGMTFVMGNPGTEIPPQYVGTADNFIIYENAGLPDSKWLGGWHSGHGKENLSCCSYDVAALDEKAIRRTSKHVGLMYVTDDVLPNPYDSLSNHLGKMMAVLDSAQHKG